MLGSVRRDLTVDQYWICCDDSAGQPNASASSLARVIARKIGGSCKDEKNLKSTERLALKTGRSSLLVRNDLTEVTIDLRIGSFAYQSELPLRDKMNRLA